MIANVTWNPEEASGGGGRLDVVDDVGGGMAAS